MIQWLVVNVLILLTSVLAILSASGTSISLLVPLTWIILVLAVIMLVNWLRMIQWVIYNTLVILMCILIILDQNAGIKTGILSPVAWIIAIVTFVLIAKDLILMRLR